MLVSKIQNKSNKFGSLYYRFYRDFPLACNCNLLMSIIKLKLHKHICYSKCQISYLSFQFVAHSNVQQLLASIWYEGLPGFRRKNMVLQALEIVRMGILFPFFSIAYIIAPHSSIGQTIRKPFIKFICHSASYFTFLCECFHDQVKRYVCLWMKTTKTQKRDHPYFTLRPRNARICE